MPVLVVGERVEPTPLHEMDSRQGIRVMYDIGQVTDLARRATAKIPDQTRSTESLISSYQNSSLNKFHD